MGLFDFPRIHVRGTHVVNVGTGNNDSASPGEEFTVTSDSERVQPVLQGKNDEDFRRWMSSLDQVGLLRAQWNYYGDMGFRFLDVRVGAVQLDAERTFTQPTQDALIGGRVYLNHALMCDANPEGFDSTQVFCESLQLSSSHAFMDGVFVSRKPSRATTRSLNWYRNVSFHGPFGLPPHGVGGELSSGGAGGASATFEHVIEVRPEDLDAVADEAREAAFHRLIGLPSSPSVMALMAALRRGAYGLIFRYNLYLCSPLLSDTELARRFEDGEQVANPAYGKVVGTIAPLWRGEESRPTMGRFLKPCRPFTNPHRPGRPYFLAPAIAHLDEAGRRLSLDLCNSLPEDGPEGKKFDLGALTVGIRRANDAGQDPAGNLADIVTLGAFANDRNRYLSLAGMVDLDLSQLPDSQYEMLLDDRYELVLCSSREGALLSETEYMVAPESACNYLDELPPGESWDDSQVRFRLAGEPTQALRGETAVYALRRGREPLEHIQMVVEQWKLTPTGTPNEYGLYKYPTLLSRESLVLEQGRGVFRLRPTHGAGLRRFRFVPAGLWPQEIAPRTLASLAFQEFFAEVRVLPFDDYSGVVDDQLEFGLIYREIFRYYHLILPAMSVRLDMSDASIWATPTAAQYVLRMIDPNLWDHYDYMPRTRDLSRYRRELLARFCRRVLREHGVPTDGGGPATPTALDPARRGRPSLLDLITARAAGKDA